MLYRYYIVLLISAIQWIPVAVYAIENTQHEEKSAELCDRFASFEDIPERTIRKAYFGFIDVDNSLAPCQAAHKADPTNTRVQAQLARIYFQQGKFVEGLALAQLAVKDQPISYVLLAYAYRKGVGGLEIDFLKSVQLLESGISQGVPDAMNDLSGHYSIGLGVTKDERRAFDLLQRAVDEGDLWAKYLLGAVYSVGRLGQKRDLEKAMQLLQASADSGLPIAQYRLSLLVTSLERKVTPGAKRYLLVSRVLFEKYAQQGSASASAYLGEMYQRGIGAPKDHEKAFELYLYAASHRHVGAMRRLGFAYVDGVGTDKNLAEGKKWLEMAANMGSKAASKKLAALGHVDTHSIVLDDTVIDGAVAKKSSSITERQDYAKRPEDEAIDPASGTNSETFIGDSKREVATIIDEPKAEAPQDISSHQESGKGSDNAVSDPVSRFLIGRYDGDGTQHEVSKDTDEPKTEVPQNISNHQNSAKKLEDEEVDPITRFMISIFQGDDIEYEDESVFDDWRAETPRAIPGRQDQVKPPEKEEIDPITRFFSRGFAEGDIEYEVDEDVDEPKAEAPHRLPSKKDQAKEPEEEEIDPITRFFGRIFDGDDIDE